MEPIHRVFFIVEGEDDAYPNYHNAKVSLSLEDPALFRNDNSFICSPLFPLYEDGLNDLPDLTKGTTITFLMVPTVFPSFSSILQQTESTNQIWFSIGLANLIIIEDESSKVSENIINLLKEDENLIAFEKWKVNDRKIIKSSNRDFEILRINKSVIHLNLSISEKLPLDLKFAVSEYILSANKFLTASKKFTPYYYDNHLRTINSSSKYINDLSFLLGDDSFKPRNSLLGNLGAESPEGARIILNQSENSQIKEELINDRHGRIIQFNSSMAYIYSQAYSGTFPLFDHIGIIRRHSLLGMGTGISALYELLIQLENALFYLPFEDLLKSDYALIFCSNDFFEPIINPGYFDNSIWKNDSTGSKVISKEIDFRVNVPDDFFNRLSFFSGRWGFREHDYSATAAIQVLVESHCLKWHIINYTHEIIHSHVRLILDQLILIPASLRDGNYNNWVEKFRKSFLSIFSSHDHRIEINDMTYLDYFRLIIIKFVLNASFYGSLSVPYNRDKWDALMADPSKTYDFLLPPSLDIRELLTHLNKDVAEIFVHVLDFNYIYKREIQTYLRSIWSSWSTVPAVSNDLKQYIVRSLVVVGLTEEIISTKRFGRVKKQFQDSIQQLLNQNSDEMILKRIINILEDPEEEQDLKNRFYNCIIVGDLVYNFFVGKLDSHLENDDKNYLYPSDLEDGEDFVTYGIDTNSFSGNEIKSKVRFLLDQLVREINSVSKNNSDGFIEKTSAWLLLSLSTQIKNV